MRIMTPPAPFPGCPDNMSKQERVAHMCYDPAEDVFITADPLDPENLYGVHDLVHVRAVAAGLKPNGFGFSSPLHLAHALSSCGAMMGAVEEVLHGSWPSVVFAPVSGFHHAGYDYCGGYCTFNGLMLGAKLARDHYGVKSVCILDGDGHWGDGTAGIIRQLRLEDKVHHVSLSEGSVKGDFQEAQTRIVEALNRRPGLVLYQAGADAHIDDPYGAGYLTDAQWDQRDNAVFSICETFNLPLVWNLAGGYNGSKTLNLHNRTFASALRVYYPESYRQNFAISPVSGSPDPASPLPVAPA